MRIVKLRGTKGKGSFHHVVKVGPVGFDPRPDWLLLASPIGARPRRTSLQWIHPSEGNIVWDRQFRFLS